MDNFIPNSVAMIRPAAFGFNPETAVSNAFQHDLHSFTHAQIQDIALLEFDNMVRMLEDRGIEVLQFSDSQEDGTPDSIFPNNWFSTFTEAILLYPMANENRRRERKEQIYNELGKLINKQVNVALLSGENRNEILEGTGSLVCDYRSKTAFAAISPRTTHRALDHFEQLTGFSTVRFEAMGPDKEEIYHTNVMMTMADEFVLIGADSIQDDDKNRVLDKLAELQKQIIILSNDQIYKHFAGNMLQLRNQSDQKFIVMSAEALSSLNQEQIDSIELFENSIISPSLHMIEKIGGGSARCMMAEIFYS